MYEIKKRRLRSAAVAGLLFSALPCGAALAQGASPTFDIRAFQVSGNKLLPPDAVERAVYPFMGPGRTEADVEGARAALQAAFEKAGYIAVSVQVPEQSVEGGILKLEVQPQTIGQVVVEGARDPEAIRTAAPSLAAGATPNLPAFQRDVTALNQKSSRRVTPELKAGTAPGTLDVVLTVEESSAWHGSLELNNQSSAATTDYRTALSLRHDDFLGRGDSLSLSAQTAPKRSKDGTVWSGNYLTRLGQGAQLMAYGVRSDSDIAVVGGTSVVGKGNIAGLRYIRSLGATEGFYHALTLGMDWKDFAEDVRLGADRASAPIEYFPLTASWRGDWTGDHAQTDLSLTGVFGVRGLGDGWEQFDAKRYKARPSFLAIKVDGSRTEDVVHGLQIFARVTGQWAADPLISNEGFSLGGASSVRGYYESEALGDYGLALQTELRSPNLTPRLGELRLRTFWDAGFTGIHDPLAGQDDGQLLSSAGLGVSLRLFNHLNGAVDVGAPLMSGPESRAGRVFARFRIWGEF